MNNQPDLSFLKVLTENPEFMQKALSIASSLSASGVLSGLTSSPGINQQKDSSAPQNSSFPSADMLLRAFSSGNSDISQKQNSFEEKESPDEHSEKNRPDKAKHKDRIRLLEAMRPFVPEERRTKLDFIIRLLGLIQVADQLGLKQIIEGR